jgi:glycerol uptake facilitator protein
MSPKPWAAPLAELLGTFVLVFLGCGAVHAAVLTGAHSGLFQVAIIWGIGVMMGIYLVGSISGAHLNPAVTIALALWGRCPWKIVPSYVVGQMAGAFVAAAALYGVFHGFVSDREADKGIGRGTPPSIITAMCYGEYYPSPGPISTSPGKYDQAAHDELDALVGQSEACGAEFVATMILALVVFAVTDSKNPGAPDPRFAPFFVGLCVAALISVIAPLTQSCLNPARDFGPRIFAMLAGWGSAAFPGPRGALGTLAVYLIAPVLGAIVGGGIYTRFMAKDHS